MSIYNQEKFWEGIKKAAEAAGELFAEFFNTRCFTSKVAEVEQFRAANATTAKNFDFLEAVAVDWENTLDTDTVGTDFTNGDGFADAFAADSDTYTFVVLNARFFTFCNGYGQTKLSPARKSEFLYRRFALARSWRCTYFHKMSLILCFRSCSGLKNFVLHSDRDDFSA